MVDVKKERPARKPLHKSDLIGVPERPGYKRRLVNENPGRVEQFIEAGWSVVDDPKAGVGTPWRIIVSRNSVGTPATAVVMEIPLEWFEEDAAAALAENQERTRSIYDAMPMSDGFYRPKTGQHI